MEIIDRYIDYNELKTAIRDIKGDDYKLVAKYSESRQKAFLANPNLHDRSTCAMSLKIMDGKVVARTMPFPTSVKLESKIYNCSSGSTLDVVEDYRKYALGAELMTDIAPGFSSDFSLSAGISKIALPLYYKLKYTVFEFPRLLLIRNSRPFLDRGKIGWLAPVINPVITEVLAILRKKISTKYIIEKVTMVPDWVGKLATNDGHRFMENHNREWLQWNLDYNFKGDKEDVQGLYIIKEGNENLGFVMIKERWRETAGTLKNLILGSIVEWGTYDDKRLSETDLINIAIPKFSKNVDLIEFASDNPTTIKAMKKCGFLPFDFAYVAFKDKKKRFPEAKDPANWRLRLGYADVILT